MLQARRSGVTLSDIQEEFEVSRRTAERLRNAVERLGWPLEEVPTDSATKHWRLPPASGTVFLNPTVEELASLESASRLLISSNRRVDAGNLVNLRDKLLALASSKTRRRIEPDLEALMEAEGIAARPGPRPDISVEVLERLREAIKRCVRVRLHYRSRDTGKLSKQLVCPYGLLYGNRHYLVGFSINPQILDYRLYSLSRIKKVELTNIYFERRKEFDLQDYSERSFGVFQEEPFDVVWKFKPEAAMDAREFVFHPSQEFEEQNDGSLIVRFRAGGWLEMCWHLFTWGDSVEVIEPEELLASYRRVLGASMRSEREGK